MNKIIKKNKLKKIGLFGASFDPPHLGHINLLKQVQSQFLFDVIKVVPLNCSPLWITPPEALGSAREEVLKQIFKGQSFIDIDDTEIKRGGVSFTIDTLKTLKSLFKEQELFLIFGRDQFLNFDQWKQFEQIIKMAHLAVCSRNGMIWNKNLFPLALRKYIKKWEDDKACLTTGRFVYRVFLKDKNVSSSEVRKRVFLKKSLARFVPKPVIPWIQKHSLYQTLPLWRDRQSERLPVFCARALVNKKAAKTQVFDLRKLPHIPFEFSLIASAENTRHTQVLAADLERQVQKKFSLTPAYRESTESWVVLDYGTLMIHIFYDFLREQVQLETLWEKGVKRLFS